jgi:hypothetical protein
MDERDLETLWDALLSRDPEQVYKAYNALAPVEREQVLAHLVRMTEEEGWQPEQRASARAALAALHSNAG